MNDLELVLAFKEIRDLSKVVKARTSNDSIVVTSCTQFEFVFDQAGRDGVRRLAEHVLCHLSAETSDKRDLRRRVLTILHGVMPTN